VRAHIKGLEGLDALEVILRLVEDGTIRLVLPWAFVTDPVPGGGTSQSVKAEKVAAKEVVDRIVHDLVHEHGFRLPIDLACFGWEKGGVAVGRCEAGADGEPKRTMFFAEPGIADEEADRQFVFVDAAGTMARVRIHGEHARIQILD
jgi:hypothetical protein